jgi:hypothetical protein
MRNITGNNALKSTTMIIFLDEEKAYRYWVTHHRRGFVLGGRDRHQPRGLTLHRATCPEIKIASARAHLTSGSQWKACALQPEELASWASGWKQDPGICPECRPLDAAAAEPAEIHLSKLGREILEYVLEAAVIHFDEESLPYRLCAGDIADCFGSTVGHLSPAFRRLFEEGMLTTTGSTKHLTPRKKIFPTVLALQGLPELAGSSEAELQDQLL